MSLWFDEQYNKSMIIFEKKLNTSCIYQPFWAFQLLFPLMFAVWSCSRAVYAVWVQETVLHRRMNWKKKEVKKLSKILLL